MYTHFSRIIIEFIRLFSSFNILNTFSSKNIYFWFCKPEEEFQMEFTGTKSMMALMLYE